MNWKNVNLKDNYERNQPIIHPLSFGTLLLEVECNCRQVDKESIMKQFEEDLRSRIDEARTVMRDNLDNILKEAQERRNMD